MKLGLVMPGILGVMVLHPITTSVPARLLFNQCTFGDAVKYIPMYYVANGKDKPNKQYHLLILLHAVISEASNKLPFTLSCTVRKRLSNVSPSGKLQLLWRHVSARLSYPTQHPPLSSTARAARHCPDVHSGSWQMKAKQFDCSCLHAPRRDRIYSDTCYSPNRRLSSQQYKLY